MHPAAPLPFGLLVVLIAAGVTVGWRAVVLVLIAMPLAFAAGLLVERYSDSTSR